MKAGSVFSDYIISVIGDLPFLMERLQRISIVHRVSEICIEEEPSALWSPEEIYPNAQLGCVCY